MRGRESGPALKPRTVSGLPTIRSGSPGLAQTIVRTAEIVGHHVWHRPARIQAMARALTADDILPLVDSLAPQERVRLQRLIASPQGGDASGYRLVPPSRDEFSTDDDPLAWDAEGWEDIG